MYELIKNIKAHEGLRLKWYKDTKGFLTIGYGTKSPLSSFELQNVKNGNEITESEAEWLLRYRLESSMNELNSYKPILKTLSENRRRILFEMSYQLGVPKLLKFVKMWAAIEKNNFKDAAFEMTNSKWAREDSPKRADDLATLMLLG
jgi:lysozyme